MNVRKQECLGHYGFGSGYLASLRAEQERQAQGVKIPSFCETCPKRAECFNRAVDEHPEGLREWVLANVRKGVDLYVSDVLTTAELPEERLRHILRVTNRIG